MSYAYLDIQINSSPIGRVVIELDPAKAPKASLNFLALCKGDQHRNGVRLTYENNKFHRIIKNFMVQAGDILPGQEHVLGTGGISIYAKEDEKANLLQGKFEDENLGDFDQLMLCAMANTGEKNGNCSQFFITTNLVPHLNGKHSIFGKVVSGKSVVREMEKLEKSDLVVISGCGEWHLGDPVPVYNACYDQIAGDVYEEYPDDETKIDDKTATAYNATNTIKEAGTALFKAQEKHKALLKYKKLLRYCNEFIPDQDSEPEYFVKFLELKKKLFLNISLTCLSVSDDEQCVKYCDYLLEMDDLLKLSDAELAKTYYRKGRALAESKKYDLALESLGKAKELMPKDKLIEVELEKLEKLKLEKIKREKLSLGRFFK